MVSHLCFANDIAACNARAVPWNVLSMDDVPGPMPPPLDALLARFRAGDTDALAALFDAAAPGLFRAALHVAPDAAAAEDALQETFLALIEAARGGAPIREVGPWLAGTLRNKVLRGRRTERRVPDVHRLAPRDGEDDPLASVERAEDRERVRRALEDLPETYREVAVLRWRYGMEPAAIAHVRGMAPGTVRSLLSRAAERLRPALGVVAVPVFAADGARGLGGVRAHVLRAARLAPPVAAGVAASAVVGGVVMAKKVAVAVALVVLLLGSWLAVQTAVTSGTPVATHGDSSAPESVAAATKARQRADADAAPETAATPAAATPAVRQAFARPQPSGTLVVRVVWDEDGTPARGVWVKVYAWDGPDPMLHMLRDRTGEDGVVTFPAVYTGYAGIYTDADGGGDAKVEAGGRREIEVRLEKGIAVEGLVVDGEGQPVADATIADRGLDIATTGADGTFRLRAIEKFASLGARAKGRAPSARHDIRGGPGSTQRLRFVLPGAGGAVEGRVLDAEGRLVAGAVVRVASANAYRQIVLEDGTPTQPQDAVEVRTDGKGAFRVEGVEVGDTVVRARAEGCALGEAKVAVTADATARTEIVLRPGGALVGVVKDGGGLPIAGAEIQVGRYGDIAGSMAHSGSDGSYRVDGLTAGAVEVKAESEGRGETAGTVNVTEGGETRWDPVLSRGCVTRGRVVDGDGRPRAKWNIRAEGIEEGASWRGTALTDAEGRFTLDNCGSPVLRVEAIAPTVADEFPWYPSVIRTDVRAGADDVVFTVKDRDVPSAFITGRVIDPDGRPVGGADIRVRHTATRITPSHYADADSGSFRIGPLPPATYELAVVAKGWPEVRLGRRTIEPGVDIDLGTVRLVTGGSAVLKVKRGDGAALGNCWGEFYAEDGAPVGYLAVEKDVARTGPLAPGRYRVRVESWERMSDACIAVLSIDVRPGEDAEVAVTLTPATFRTFRVTAADGSEIAGNVSYVLRDDTGAVVRQGEYRSVVGFAFTPGTYTVEASTESGLRATARFEAGGATSRDTQVVLALH